ncbi:MAG: putative sugar nucleotidyl transferase [Thermoguttaceae bacterium]
MHTIVFEDTLVGQLFPATAARPAFCINIGTMRLIDVLRRLGGTLETVVRPFLSEIVSQEFTDIWTPALGSRRGPVVVVNARVVPHIKVVDQILALVAREKSCVCRVGGQLACAILHDASFFPTSIVGASQLVGLIDDLALPQHDITFSLLDYAHDIIRHQERIIDDNLADRIKNGSYREIADGVFSADGRSLGEYAVCDTSKGPVVVESNVSVGPYCYFRGPVYIGSGVKLIEHAAIKDAATIGSITKVGGEVEASIIEPYSNKQHHGFLGHSYLGSWVNLGAGTSNSDLKNTYGEVTLEYGNQKVRSGMQFVGCVIGDYSKSAINTSIFTGKTIGVCSMIYGFVSTNVPSFVNYARSFGQVTEITVDVLIQTQARMFARRNVPQRPCDIQLIRDMYELTRHERHLANEPLSL